MGMYMSLERVSDPPKIKKAEGVNESLVME
jgi:hypothetical protein